MTKGTKAETRLAGRVSITGEGFMQAQDSTKTALQQPIFPSPNTEQEKALRDYRALLDKYGRGTGDRRALTAAECLTTYVLIEGGCRP